MLQDSTRAFLGDQWPAAAAVSRSHLPEALAAIRRGLAGQGLTRLGADPALGGMDSAAVVMAELGRAACPVSLAPTVIANLLFGSITGDILSALHTGESALALAFGQFDGDPAAGRAAIAAGRVTGRLRFVEHGDEATHLLVFGEESIAIVARDAPGAAVIPTPGLAIPSLSDIVFDEAPATILPANNVHLADGAHLMRLLLVARAAGAARRGFEMAVEHVQQRKQFGQPLARFQAMQHKLAQCLITLTATRVLIDEAVASHDRGDAAWRLAADVAVAYAAARLRQVSLETHHAFGAIGYAEDHEAPRHFRRVHADLLRMGGPRAARRRIVEAALAAAPPGLPGIDTGPASAALRNEVRSALQVLWDDHARTAERASPFHERGWSWGFARRMGEDGWISLGWPKERGGRGGTPLEQLAFVEELARANAPSGSFIAAAWIVAPEIMRHGAPELQSELLPAIARGEVAFCLGYSESEAGSDLAALRTRAVRDGDHYVITGQKLWGTGTDRATHVILAARTDPDARPRHAGISLFIVPIDSPGVTVVPVMAMYGHTFSTQFYDEVRVPVANRLGEENGGWPILTEALAGERILMGGQVAIIECVYSRLLAHFVQCGSAALDPLTIDKMGELGADIQAARLLSIASVRVLEAGRLPLLEGAITKIFTGELSERFSEAAIELVGTSGLLGEGSAGAPLDGGLEQGLRRSLMSVIGGGAAEIQLTLIAQHGLGIGR